MLGTIVQNMAGGLTRCAGAMLARGGALAIAMVAADGGDALAELRELAQPRSIAVVSAPTLDASTDGRTRFSLKLSEPLDRQIFELRTPDRLVIDLPEVEWRLDAGGAAAMDFSKHPHVEKLRVGLFRPGRSRLVLDLGATPEGLTHKVVEAADGSATLLIEFGFMGVAGTGRAPARAEQSAVSDVRLASAGVIAVKPRPRPKPFVVVVDPGHGGHDGGAVATGVREKDVVLAVSRNLKRELEKDPRIQVVLTRNRDQFIPLPGRVRVAREAKADLFISIHADSLPGHPEVGGASVYTLSENASDRVAAQLARSENDADRLAGISEAPREADIRNIVFDYKRRVAMEESGDFADLIVSSLRRRITVLGSRAHRHAGFHVLRNFNAPSALVELGFVTNLKDRRRLNNPAWQETAALGLAEAVRAWLRRDVVDMRMARASAAPY